MNKYNFNLNPYDLIETVKNVKNEKRAKAEEKTHIVIQALIGMIISEAEKGNECVQLSVLDIYDILYSLKIKENEFSLNELVEKYGADKHKESQTVFYNIKNFFDEETMFDVDRNSYLLNINWIQQNIEHKIAIKEREQKSKDNVQDRTKYINIFNMILIEKETGRKYVRTNKKVNQNSILLYKKEYFTAFMETFDNEKTVFFPNHCVDDIKGTRSFDSACHINKTRDENYYNKNHAYRKYKVFKPIKEF